MRVRLSPVFGALGGRLWSPIARLFIIAPESPRRRQACQTPPKGVTVRPAPCSSGTSVCGRGSVNFAPTSTLFIAYGLRTRKPTKKAATNDLDKSRPMVAALFSSGTSVCGRGSVNFAPTSSLFIAYGLRSPSVPSELGYQTLRSGA